jgi:hypothetical protein
MAKPSWTETLLLMRQNRRKGEREVTQGKEVVLEVEGEEDRHSYVV